MRVQFVGNQIENEWTIDVNLVYSPQQRLHRSEGFLEHEPWRRLHRERAQQNAYTGRLRHEYR